MWKHKCWKCSKKHPQIAGLEHVDLSQIEKLVFTCATELEFWVKSPREDAPIEAFLLRR